MKTEEITSPALLMEMANAFRVSRIILTANELGVFDLLSGDGATSSLVAATLNTDVRATDRLLNALVSVGLLNKQGECYRNTGFAGKFLVTTAPAYLGGLSLASQTWRTWSTLTEAVRQGTTVAMSAHINERTDTWKESFIAAMHARAGKQAVETADALDLSSTGKVLDVGGGSGAFAFAMIRRNPFIRATIFDLPNIIPITERYIAQSGLSDKVDTVTGDYLADDLGKDYDLALMSAIIHINSPEENILLIRKGAAALNPGGQLVILDHIMSADRTEPAVGAIFALNMLVGTLHGDTYTRDEISGWMEAAGLTDIVLKETPSGVQLMTGRKPAGA
ncbi:MAG: methyltransferase [Bacteroidota bacterium]